MPKQRSKWAPHDGSWGPVKPGFWEIWRNNKKSLKNNGYSVRLSDTGEWQVRFTPPGWPAHKREAVFVPQGMKASLCLKCGQVRLIDCKAEHQACGICGAGADYQP